MNLDDKPYIDPATGTYAPKPKHKPWGPRQYIAWAIIVAVIGYLLWAGAASWIIHSDDCPSGAGYDQCMDNKAQRSPRDALMRLSPSRASRSALAGTAPVPR